MFRKLYEKRYALAGSTSLAVLALPFQAYATEEGTTPPMTTLLGEFTSVAAWFWAEIGKLLTWILGQPILLLSMSLFFVGAIVSFFIRVFHSV